MIQKQLLSGVIMNPLILSILMILLIFIQLNNLFRCLKANWMQSKLRQFYHASSNDFRCKYGLSSRRPNDKFNHKNVKTHCLVK